MEDNPIGCFKSNLKAIWRSVKYFIALLSIFITPVDTITNWYYIFDTNFAYQGFFISSLCLTSFQPFLIYIGLMIKFFRARFLYFMIWIIFGPLLSILYPIFFLSKLLDIDISVIIDPRPIRLASMISETIPMLIIQGINNSLVNTWSTFTIVSFIFSALNIVNGSSEYTSVHEEDEKESFSGFVDFISEKMIQKLEIKFSDEEVGRNIIKYAVVNFLISVRYKYLQVSSDFEDTEFRRIFSIITQGIYNRSPDDVLRAIREKTEAFNPFNFTYSEYMLLKQLLIRIRKDYTQTFEGLDKKKVKELVSCQYRKLLYIKLWYKKPSFKFNTEVLKFIKPIIKNFHDNSNKLNWGLEGLTKNKIQTSLLFFWSVFSVFTILCNIYYIINSKSTLKFVFLVFVLLKAVFTCNHYDIYKKYTDFFFLRLIFSIYYTYSLNCLFSEPLNDIKNIDDLSIRKYSAPVGAIVLMLVMQIIINQVFESWDGINLLSFILNGIEYLYSSYRFFYVKWRNLLVRIQNLERNR